MQLDPAELSDNILERLKKILHASGHVGRVSEFQRRSLHRDIDRLAQKNAYDAYIHRSALLSLEGDEGASEDCLVAASKLNADSRLYAQRMFNRSNYGRASETLRLFREVAKPGTADLSLLFHAMLPMGGFESVCRVIEQSVALNQVLGAECNEYIDLARRGARSLQRTGYSEDQLAQVLDVAGEVQREQQLLWLDKAPRYVLLTGDESDDSAPGVHFYFSMDLDPQEALELSSEVQWRLVDRNLVMPGLTAAFVGTRQLVECA